MFSRYKNGSESIPAKEWMPTGDLMYRDPEGNYYFKGRLKDIVKSGGENVFAGEVEAVLRELPGLRDCAVFGTPDDILGETVTAALVREEGAALTAEDVSSFCRQRLAGFKIPRRLYFVKQLPATATGRVKKTVLREMAMQGELDEKGAVR